MPSVNKPLCLLSHRREDYLRQLLAMEWHQPADHLIPLGRLAAALLVTPGTATVMIKSLADTGLVLYRARKGVRLTSKGKRLALCITRRNQLIKLFLVRKLNMDWSEVHDDADQIEHAMSEKLTERIAEMLDHPIRDLYGFPIATSDGIVNLEPATPLADAQPEEPLRIVRLADQSRVFLQFAADHHMVPDGKIRVIDNSQLGGALQLRIGRGSDFALGDAVAAKVYVTQDA
jgi:DtxR family Mn-dependent transcriptional regulator